MFKLRHTALDHEGGTKDYDIFEITVRSGEGAIVRRWGKVGSPGEVKFEVGTDGWARTERAKLQRNKQSRGYHTTKDTTSEHESIQGVLNTVTLARGGRIDSVMMKAIEEFFADAEMSDLTPAATTPAGPAFKAEDQPEIWGEW